MCFVKRKEKKNICIKKKKRIYVRWCGVLGWRKDLFKVFEILNYYLVCYIYKLVLNWLYFF